MTEAFALLGALDIEHRSEMITTLQGAGYRVCDCGSAQQLSDELCDTAALSSDHLLIMAGLEFAILCGGSISTLASSRARAGRSRPLVVLLCERDPLMQSLPDLEFCKTTVILLDTFDPSDLGQLHDRNPLSIPVPKGDGYES